MKVDVICENHWCNKPFKGDSWNVRRNRDRFCSMKCRNEWMSIRMSGRKKKKDNKTCS